MNNKRIIITGVNGYIGSFLRRTIESKYISAKIFGIDKNPTNDSLLHYDLDLLDINAVKDCIYEIRPHYLFHLAGTIYSTDLVELYNDNVRITINILEAIKSLKENCRVIIPGSAAEYGNVDPHYMPILEDQSPNPISIYGVSKVWQTTVARYYANLGLDIVVGRIFNLIGKNISVKLVIGSIINQLKSIINHHKAPIIQIGNTKSKRDFIDIEDVCYGLICLGKDGKRGEIYNICSCQPISIEEIIQYFIINSGLSIQVENDSKRIKAQDIDLIYGSNKKIANDTGWERKVSIEQSIKQILEDVRL